MILRSRFIEKVINTIFYAYGAVAQLARAPALQAGGQEFDSPQLHHADLKISGTYASEHIEKYIDEIR